jgi:hypothetical protein
MQAITVTLLLELRPPPVMAQMQIMAGSLVALITALTPVVLMPVALITAPMQEIIRARTPAARQTALMQVMQVMQATQVMQVMQATLAAMRTQRLTATRTICSAPETRLVVTAIIRIIRAFLAPVKTTGQARLHLRTQATRLTQTLMEMPLLTVVNLLEITQAETTRTMETMAATPMQVVLIQTMPRPAIC